MFKDSLDLEKNISMTEEYTRHIREIKNKTIKAHEERMKTLESFGVEKAVQTVAELLVLERVLCSLKCLVQNFTPEIDAVQSALVFERSYMEEFLTLELSQYSPKECDIVKKFMNVIINNTKITKNLYPENY